MSLLAGTPIARRCWVWAVRSLPSSGGAQCPWLATLDVPTLVLCGEEDPMAPVANSKLIASLIPGAELQIYDEAGHLFIFERSGRRGRAHQ